MNKEGTLTDTSWNQLHTALKIYRDKRFETFRYLFVDNKGMIKDQLTLCSYLPNRTVATLPGKNIIPNIIKHAEETQTRIILAHNHPAGSTSPSFEDVLTTQKLKRIFTNSRGKSLLLGHIILDHDTAEIYDNSKANWYTIQTNKTNKDPLTKNDPLAKTELLDPLKPVASMTIPLILGYAANVLTSTMLPYISFGFIYTVYMPTLLKIFSGKRKSYIPVNSDMVSLPSSIGAFELLSKLLSKRWKVLKSDASLALFGL